MLLDFFVIKGSGSLTLSPLRLMKGENPVPMQEGGACCGGSGPLLPRCYSLLCPVTALCFASLPLMPLPRCWLSLYPVAKVVHRR